MNSVSLSLIQTYDENLNVDKLKDEWKHHSPYFWLERMTFLAAFGFDIPEAGLKYLFGTKVKTHLESLNTLFLNHFKVLSRNENGI